jgi:hypothetical protein
MIDRLVIYAASSLTPRRVRTGVVAIAALALALHARSLDAVSDDAYISLRYARNLAFLGAPVYNPGERVEGYSSPVWMVLSAFLLRVGIEPRAALSLLGALGGLALIVSVWRLWIRLAPEKPAHGMFVLALVAASTPIAAWTCSGLETPLFAALVVLVVAELSACTEAPTKRRAWFAGLSVALATLTRPEGVLLVVIAFAWLAAHKPSRSMLVPFAVAALTPLVAFEVFRFVYYGTLLPNTHYAKVSAPARDRLWNGLGYAWFAVTEMGYGHSLLLLFGLLVPTRSKGLWLARLVVVLLVVYVIVVGGDFLDLFRFFVPVLPLLYVTLIASSIELAERVSAQKQTWVIAAAIATPAFVLAQIGLRSRALQIDEPARRARWIEPLGWTKHYGIVWADAGRFLREHAHPTDTMAAPAAGAMPYYAELPNLDLFGLTDVEVAKNGHANGHRPGHQRFAKLEYVLRKRPTFIMLDECTLPGAWAGWKWTDSGYECVIVRAPTSSGGQMRLTFLVEHERAEELGRKKIAYRLRRP